MHIGQYSIHGLNEWELLKFENRNEVIWSELDKGKNRRRHCSWGLGSYNNLGEIRLTWLTWCMVEAIGLLKRDWFKSSPLKVVHPNFVQASLLWPIYRFGLLAKYLSNVLAHNERMLKLEVGTDIIKFDAFLLQKRKLSSREIEIPLRVSCWWKEPRLNLLCLILLCSFISQLTVL